MLLTFGVGWKHSGAPFPSAGDGADRFLPNSGRTSRLGGTRRLVVSDPVHLRSPKRASWGLPATILWWGEQAVELFGEGIWRDGSASW